MTRHEPGCACGAHAPAPDDPHTQRQPGEVSLTGKLACRDMAQMMAVLDHASDHVAASRAEPGCIRFDLVQTDDPLVFAVAERFRSVEAYRAHQARTRASAWGRATADIERRDFDRRGLDQD